MLAAALRIVAFRALIPAALIVLLLAGIAGVARWASEEPLAAYMDESGQAYVLYSTVRYTNFESGSQDLLPVDEAYARLERDFGHAVRRPRLPASQLLPVEFLVVTGGPDETWRSGGILRVAMAFGLEPIPDERGLPIYPVPPGANERDTPACTRRVQLEIWYPAQQLPDAYYSPPDREMADLRRYINEGGADIPGVAEDGIGGFSWFDGKMLYKLAPELPGCSKLVSRGQMLAIVESILSH